MRLQAEGLPPGRFGMIGDPDGIRLQLLGTPGGLAKSTEPAGRIAPDEALVKPLALESVVLNVSSVEKALPFYRMFFGREAQPGWFHIADTRLGLQQVPEGKTPMVGHFRVNVARFDPDVVAAAVQKLGATDLTRDGKEGLLRFSDPDGIVVELKGV